MKKKVKKVEVSSKSFLGRPSQMDKEIKKWTAQGWTLANTTSVKKNRFLLTFEYVPQDTTKEPNRVLGCIVLLGIIFGCSLAFNSLRTTFSTVQATKSPTIQSHVGSAPTRTIRPSNTVSPSASPTLQPTATNTIRPTSRPTLTFTPTPIQAKVVSNQNVNLRQEPSTDANIVTVLKPQSLLTVLGENDDATWLNVETHDSEKGWISAPLVQIVSNENTVEPTSTPPVSHNTQSNCVPNFKRLGSFFRLTNSYEAVDYSTYSYDIVGLFSSGTYTLTLDVGEQWEGVVFPVTMFDHHEGYMVLEGVRVDYLYEGDLGYNESIGFSFEHGNLKYSGILMVSSDTASPRDRSKLREALGYFVSRIVNC